MKFSARWNLRLQLLLSFLLLAAITFIVGGSGYLGISRLKNAVTGLAEVRIPGMGDLMLLSKAQQTAKTAERTLLNPNLTHQQKEKAYSKLKNALVTVKQQLQSYGELPHNAEDSETLQRLRDLLENWESQVRVTITQAHELDQLDILNPPRLVEAMERIKRAHTAVVLEVMSSVWERKPHEGKGDPKHCKLAKFKKNYHTTNSHLLQIFRDVEPFHSGFHTAVAQINEALKQGRYNTAARILRNELLPNADEVLRHLDLIEAEALKADEIYRAMNENALQTSGASFAAVAKLLQKIVSENQDMALSDGRRAATTGHRAASLLLVFLVVGTFLALVLGIAISGAVTRRIRKIMEELSQSSQTVASASREVAQGGQKLAENSTDQAASLEETSASLEEINGMIKATTKNALETKEVMQNSHRAIREANSGMKELTAAMQQIAASSAETQAIVKTIDEIAFQTNLLALNAAVEAARAGEAGAGFAVVADEVRSLAMRSAEAARTTAALIENSVEQINRGNKFADQAGESFEKITQSSETAVSLASQIAQAISEQQNAVAQITTAVSSLDQNTQHNASTAQESAAAAQQLKAESQNLQRLVDQLRIIVRGTEQS